MKKSNTEIKDDQMWSPLSNLKFFSLSDLLQADGSVQIIQEATQY